MPVGPLVIDTENGCGGSTTITTALVATLPARSRQLTAIWFGPGCSGTIEPLGGMHSGAKPLSSPAVYVILAEVGPTKLKLIGPIEGGWMSRITDTDAEPCVPLADVHVTVIVFGPTLSGTVFAFGAAGAPLMTQTTPVGSVDKPFTWNTTFTVG